MSPPVILLSAAVLRRLAAGGKGSLLTASCSFLDHALSSGSSSGAAATK